MLRLAHSWVWDFWLADDGERFHLFFLKASRALLDPDRRHAHASVGHAVSTDLTTWTEVADALVPSDGPAFDDRATWTGSVVRGPAGRWWMFYTGVDHAHGGLRQRVGAAVSEDLVSWERVSDDPVCVADPRWYELLDEGGWPDEAWRDPWVLPDPGGAGWHLLLTARAREGETRERGVVGHAWSEDLEHWTVRPPLSRPGAGFAQLEVTQVEVVDGRPVLLFSCEGGELGGVRRGQGGGIWAVPVDDVTGPYDVGRARLLHDESLYVGRLVRDRSGAWQLLAFRNRVPGGFGGEITDPVPVRWGADGHLELARGVDR